MTPGLDQRRMKAAPPEAAFPLFAPVGVLGRHPLQPMHHLRQVLHAPYPGQQMHMVGGDHIVQYFDEGKPLGRLKQPQPVLPAVIGEPEQEPPFLAAVGHMHATLLDLGPWQTHPFSDSQGTAYHERQTIQQSQL